MMVLDNDLFEKFFFSPIVTLKKIVAEKQYPKENLVHRLFSKKICGKKETKKPQRKFVFHVNVPPCVHQKFFFE